MKNEQPMTGRESLELISAMIVDTRRRYHFEDGRLHLFWGYLDIAVALLVWGVAYFTQSVWANLLWWLIPVVGIPVSRLLSRRNVSKGYALSYTDRMISSMWRYVGFLSFAFALICLFFSFGGHPQVWMLMFFYSFLVVGMGTAVVGLLLDYRSMRYGGGFSILTGRCLCPHGDHRRESVARGVGDAVVHREPCGYVCHSRSSYLCRRPTSCTKQNCRRCLIHCPILTLCSTLDCDWRWCRCS